MRILVVDNYDSFTYNLVHLVEKILGTPVTTLRNDAIDMAAVNDFDKIILSPGPGIPTEAGLLLPIIQQYAATKSILGVCLGCQAIGEACGGRLKNLDNVFHGVATPIFIQTQYKSPLFKGLGTEIEVGRYHSWVVDKKNLPDCLEITAVDENGYIMALQHKEWDLQGVQFHPESILTPDGEAMMRNWLFEKK